MIFLCFSRHDRVEFIEYFNCSKVTSYLGSVLIMLHDRDYSNRLITGIEMVAAIILLSVTSLCSVSFWSCLYYNLESKTIPSLFVFIVNTCVCQILGISKQFKKLWILDTSSQDIEVVWQFVTETSFFDLLRNLSSSLCVIQGQSV